MSDSNSIDKLKAWKEEVINLKQDIESEILVIRNELRKGKTDLTKVEQSLQLLEEIIR